MTQAELLTRIPAQDWEATPESVRTLLLSLPLEVEVADLQGQVQTFEATQNAVLAAMKGHALSPTSMRYQDLVEKLFIDGLSEEEAQEMERLGRQIDAGDTSFDGAAMKRMEALSRK